MRIRETATLQLDQEQLNNMVQLLRDGDDTYRETIIKHLMPMAAKISYRISGRRDAIQSGYLGLVQAVAWAPERMIDNNIVPYAIVTIRRHVLDFIRSDHLVCLPAKVCKIQFAIDFKAQHTLIDYEIDRIGKEDEDRSGYYSAIEILKLNDEDIMIIDLILSGYKLREIAIKLGRTHEWMRKRKHILKRRYRELYSEGAPLLKPR